MEKGHIYDKYRKDFDDTSSSMTRSAKKNRAQNGTYANAADPLMKVAEGYPDEVMTTERLLLLRNAISEEIDGIRESPMLRFHGTFLKGRGRAVVVKCVDEA